MTDAYIRSSLLMATLFGALATSTIVMGLI